MRVALVVLLALAASARAHWADLAVMEVTVRPEGTRITLTIPGGLIPEGDVDGDRKVTVAEVPQRAAEIVRALATKVVLLSPGRPPVPFRIAGAGAPTGTRVDPRVAADLPGDSHLSLKLEFDPAPVEGLRLRYDLWIADAPQASCLANIHRGPSFVTHVFNPRDREITVGEPLSAGMPARGARDAIARPFAALCVLALLIAGAASFGGVLAAAGAFLAACAGGYALAGLDVVHLAPGITGALAAGAVVLVAALNLGASRAGDRVMIALAAGLVQGAYLVEFLRAAVPADELRAVLPLYGAGALAALGACALAAGLLGLALDAAGKPARAVRIALSLLAALAAVALRAG